MKKSPLDSHVLYYEKAPLFQEKRFRSPLPKPPITEPLIKLWYGALDHPLITFLLLLLTVFPLPTASAQAKPHSVAPSIPAWQKTIAPLATFSPPIPAPMAPAAPVYIAPPPPPPAPVTNCGSDPYMAYIYRVESGCRTDAVNPGGCIGLGQACPGGKLPCSMYDWGCQDAWFRSYAVAAYGSIYAAYVFRAAHNWW